MPESPPSALRLGFRFVTLIAFAAGVGGCALFMEAPEVRIAEVRVTGVGLTGADAEVALRVVNPNGRGLTSRMLEYAVAFDQAASGEGSPRWRTLAEGRDEREVRVEARDTARVVLSVPFRYEDVGSAVGRLLRDGELRYRVSGAVTFDGPLGDVRVPFRDTGQIGF